VIERAVGALRGLAGWSEVTADSFAQIADLGGVQLLHKAMQDNATHAGIIMQAVVPRTC
jgi:hypothetical protein